MKISQFQSYAFDPDDLDAELAKHNPQSRTPVLVEVFDGDAKRFGFVRADLTQELCDLLNNAKT